MRLLRNNRVCTARALASLVFSASVVLPGHLGASPSTSSVKQTRPNILYIFTDDQSTRSVSCYAESRPWAKTPNINDLAASGMRFTTCYTGAWCQPSRASALSGLLQHGIQTLRITNYPMAEYDPKKLRFFPSVFREKGYETACIGKWHLGSDVGHGRDWDYSVIWDRGPKDSGERRGDRNAGAYYTGTLVRTNGGHRKPLNGYSTDRYTELAVDYIKSKKRDSKPWYLWLCYGGVHSPYTPASRHDDAYSHSPPSEVPVDIFGPRLTKPKHLRNMTRWTKDKNGEPRGYDRAVKKYHRAVKSLDDGVGALVQALEESGQLNDTVIIFTSDQGFAWGQHGSMEKWLPYDANICAPLIFSAPGRIKPGALCREPVNGVDIVSTIHAIADIDPEWPLHGRDLSGLLDSPGESLGEPMLMINTTYEYGERIEENLKEKNYEIFERRGLYAWMMMRDGRYKYIRHLKDNVIEEVYDLEEDPKELSNLAGIPQFNNLLASLRQKAVEEFRKKGGSFVDSLPEPKLR